MARVLVTPISAANVEPFVLEGKLTSKYCDGYGLVYYICGASFPKEIVTILDDGPFKENYKKICDNA